MTGNGPDTDWLDLLDTLAQTYKPEGIGLWLFGANRSLPDRKRGTGWVSPIEAIREGRMEEVLGRARQLEKGNFG